jgi:hypothetical protein
MKGPGSDPELTDFDQFFNSYIKGSVEPRIESEEKPIEPEPEEQTSTPDLPPEEGHPRPNWFDFGTDKGNLRKL